MPYVRVKKNEDVLFLRAKNISEIFDRPIKRFWKHIGRCALCALCGYPLLKFPEENFFPSPPIFWRSNYFRQNIWGLSSAQFHFLGLLCLCRPTSNCNTAKLNSMLSLSMQTNLCYQWKLLSVVWFWNVRLEFIIGDHCHRGHVLWELQVKCNILESTWKNSTAMDLKWIEFYFDTGNHRVYWWL